MVKAIIFDCFGVLTTDHWKEFLASLAPGQVEPARALMYRHDAGRLSEADLIAEVKKLTGQTPRGVERLFNDEKIKNTELLEYIGAHKTDYKMGLLSNIGSNWIRARFLSRDEQALFDDMVFSYEVGMAKPDPGIFELTAERLGVATNQCVLVDDSDGHCEAARRSGFKTVLYENFQQMEQELEPLLADTKS